MSKLDLRQSLILIASSIEGLKKLHDEIEKNMNSEEIPEDLQDELIKINEILKESRKD